MSDKALVAELDSEMDTEKIETMPHWFARGEFAWMMLSDEGRATVKKAHQVLAYRAIRAQFCAQEDREDDEPYGKLLNLEGGE